MASAAPTPRATDVEAEIPAIEIIRPRNDEEEDEPPKEVKIMIYKQEEGASDLKREKEERKKHKQERKEKKKKKKEEKEAMKKLQKKEEKEKAKERIKVDHLTVPTRPLMSERRPPEKKDQLKIAGVSVPRTNLLPTTPQLQPNPGIDMLLARRLTLKVLYLVV